MNQKAERPAGEPGSADEPRTSRLRRALAVALSLGVLLAPACADAGQEPPSEGSDAAEAASRTRPEISPEELGGIDPADVGLVLPWTNRPVSAEARSDATPARTVAEVRFEAGAGLDRMTVEFADEGSIPSYEVRSYIRSLPYCEGADSVRSTGPGLLRVRLPRVAADSAVAAPAEDVAAGLGNVSAVHLTCLRDNEVEWVLDVGDATSYRMVHLSGPTRLVVDVRHAVEVEEASGEDAPAEEAPGAP